VAAKEIVIQTYSNEREMAKDMNRWLKRGYEVINQEFNRENHGCLYYILTGGLGLLFGGSHWVVTYRRVD
jgi:hypothetical protein